MSPLSYTNAYSGAPKHVRIMGMRRDYYWDPCEHWATDALGADYCVRRRSTSVDHDLADWVVRHDAIITEWADLVRPIIDDKDAVTAAILWMCDADDLSPYAVSRVLKEASRPKFVPKFMRK